MVQPSKEKADTAEKVGNVPAQMRGGAPVFGPHWFIQENDLYDFENNPEGELVKAGRYLKVYATSMVEVNGDLIFYDDTPEEVLRFPLGTWAYMEHGFEEAEMENVDGE